MKAIVPCGAADGNSVVEEHPISRGTVTKIIAIMVAARTSLLPIFCFTA
jgi:hypothetical protein